MDIGASGCEAVTSVCMKLTHSSIIFSKRRATPPELLEKVWICLLHSQDNSAGSGVGLRSRMENV